MTGSNIRMRWITLVSHLSIICSQITQSYGADCAPTEAAKPKVYDTQAKIDPES